MKTLDWSVAPVVGSLQLVLHFIDSTMQINRTKMIVIKPDDLDNHALKPF